MEVVLGGGFCLFVFYPPLSLSLSPKAMGTFLRKHQQDVCFASSMACLVYLCVLPGSVNWGSFLAVEPSTWAYF